MELLIFVELKRRLWQAHCGNAWGKWRLVSVAIFIAHKKKGHSCPHVFLISSQTEILKQE